jgi:alpha,alpha-trehalase
MSHPIAEYALLSDCRSAALVHRAGSIDWLSFPRFDSPSVFCRLLDDEGGHWSISVPGATSVHRRYLDHTLVLETEFESPGGRLVLTDAMAMGPNERGHQLGAASPHAVLRRVECTAGTVDVDMEFAPSPDYGRMRPALRAVTGGVLSPAHGDSILRLSCRPEDIGTAPVRFTLRAAESRAWALHYHEAGEAGEFWDEERIAGRLRETVAAWQSWSSEHQSYQGPWQNLVHLSGRVLQGLTYEPTGAIVAAPTTSLPETVGGARNWDYRYTWVRDASLTLVALWIAACPDEANQYFDFLAGAASRQLRDEGQLQVMFGVAGERDLTERELPHLGGWRGSRPVRIGNGAFGQRQLDVYGELIGALHRLKDRVGTLAPDTVGFLVEVADTALRRWQLPDHGMWEIRDEPRHFVHSKLMCWLALDRALDMRDVLSADAEKVRVWGRGREEIRAAILDKGWSDRAGAFTQAFGSDALDGSALLIPITGFLPPNDPRVRSTVDAIAERLTDSRGLVYRYRTEDGLTGEEGSFLLCTFWLAHALALAGDVARARETFERAAAFANDLGLMSEEVDEATGEMLGNFPQAFSHVGLVGAAWAIQQAEAGGTPLTSEPLR